MAWFGKRSAQVGDAVDDETWLRQGSARFESGRSRHFGSPETMRAGGSHALRSHDLAAALYYFAKAIDIAQTWSFSRPGERDVQLDADLFDDYASLVETIRRTRPGVDLGTGWQSAHEANVVPLMMSIVANRAGYGPGPAPQLEAYARRVVTATEPA